jgi:predicted nucleic acid-binding protein
MTDNLIFDTSALFNFGHRGELGFLLDRMAGHYRLYTTDKVVTEIRDPKRKEYYEKFVKKHFTVEKPGDSGISAEQFLRLSSMLHTGEISVILLAACLKGRPVLDDQAARAEAAKLGLNVTGTLGLLNDAILRKWLTDSECLARVAKLCDAHFNIPRPAPHQTFADYVRTLE